MDDVSKAENPEHKEPVFSAVWHQRERHANQTVEAEFFQHAGVEHCRGSRGGTVSEWRPGMKRPERHQNTEAKHRQRKNPSLRRKGHWLRLEIFGDPRNAERALARRHLQ